LEKWVGELPYHKQIHVRRMTDDRRRSASALGYQLLKHAMMCRGDAGFALQSIRFRPHEKPRVPGSVDFNISHSDALVACVVSRQCRVGVDAERVRKTAWPRTLMRDVSAGPSTWTGKSPAKAEYAAVEQWVAKESVIKAHGGSGIGDLPNVRIRGERAIYRNENWYLTQLTLIPDYVVYVASDDKPEDFHVHRVHPDDLSKNTN
jgi:4'-phosphopantetheinyl transferase